MSLLKPVFDNIQQYQGCWTVEQLWRHFDRVPLLLKELPSPHEADEVKLKDYFVQQQQIEQVEWDEVFH